jgi:hypothetical protein
MGKTTKKNGSGPSSLKDGMIDVDPECIRFTHARIRPFFTGQLGQSHLTSNTSHIIFTRLLHSISYYLEGCGRRIEDTLGDIVSGKMKVTDLPKITVISNEGYHEYG